MATDTGPKPQKEINRLKARVKHLQKDRDKSFPDLGRATYQAFLDGKLTEPALVESGNRIRAIENEIEQASAEIVRLQGVIQQMKTAPALIGTCASCGAGVTAGLRFCGSCGAPLVQQAPAPGAVAACPTCGAPMGPGSRFCGECGASLEPAPAPQAPPAPPPPAAAVPVPPPTAAAPPEEPSTPKCPSCGAAVEEAGAAFCGECGTRL